VSLEGILSRRRQLAQSIFVTTGQGYTDRSCQQISICGKQLVLDPSGALYMPSARVVVLSDLVTNDRSGQVELKRRKIHRLSEKMALLDDVLQRFQPEHIVALGAAPIRRDEFDDLEGAAHEMFFSYFEQYNWHWVGPVLDDEPGCDADVEAHDVLEVSGFMLRHRPILGPVTHEISGGLNPAAFIGAPEYAIRRPCFVSNGMRLVLPKFGAYRGGENVLDNEFKSIFTDDGLQVWMLGYEGVQPVACRQLRSD